MLPIQTDSLHYDRILSSATASTSTVPKRTDSGIIHTLVLIDE